jgi:putative oxygen-independent coproporphyrinogen III oxidase
VTVTPAHATGNLTAVAPVAREEAGRPFGVYVHFPFCLRKCGYCDFVSFKAAREEIPHEAYADAIVRELDARSAGLTGELRTVFFGGGTPSLWDPTALGRVLDAIRTRFVAAGARANLEVTVECNPTSLDLERAKALRDQGVNRLSIGIQGLDDRRLAFLERLHDADSGLRAIDDALASGIERVSADLIFGVATEHGVETPAQAAAEAARIAATGITHVSAYALTVEPNTSFGARARAGKLPIAPDEDVVEALFEVERTLERLGFEHYEVSNYAQPGARSRHNVGYWLGLDYLGLGAGAVGCLSAKNGSGRRTRNTGDPRRYIDQSADPPSIEIESEILAPGDRLNERIMLGLRLREGFDVEAAAREVGVDPYPRERVRAIEKLEAAGRIERAGGTLRVPRAALHLLDGTAAQLFC